MIGEGVRIGSDNVLAAGARIFPGVELARRSDQILSTTAISTREAIAAVDAARLLDDILGLPDQLRDALWRVESANLEPHDSPGGLVVAGMGGSAIGGALARAALGDRASRPIVLARGYALPAWTTPDTTVLCSSYSGNTEETLAVYEAAGALGARRIVATTGGKLAEQARADGVPVIPLPGGFQPRAAVAYSLVIALEVAASVRRGRAAARRDRRRRRARRGARRRLGPRRARGLPGQGARARPARHDPADRGRRPDRTDRVPLEDADQRERQDRRASRTSCPSSTTTRSPAGRARPSSGGSAPCSSTTPTCTRASASGSS